MNITKKQIQAIQNLYKRVAAAFNNDVGTEEQSKILVGFENLLTSFGIKIVEPVYGVMSYYVQTSKEKRWGIYEKTDREWVLTGFKTADEAVAVAKDKSIFQNYDGSEITVVDMGVAA